VRCCGCMAPTLCDRARAHQTKWAADEGPDKADLPIDD
jgi:hypothetical protein